MILVLFAPFQPSNAIGSRIGVILLVYPLHFCVMFQGSYKYDQTKKETIISDTMVILNCPSIPFMYTNSASLGLSLAKLHAVL